MPLINPNRLPKFKKGTLDNALTMRTTIARYLKDYLKDRHEYKPFQYEILKVINTEKNYLRFLFIVAIPKDDRAVFLIDTLRTRAGCSMYRRHITAERFSKEDLISLNKEPILNFIERYAPECACLLVNKTLDVIREYLLLETSFKESATKENIFHDEGYLQHFKPEEDGLVRLYELDG